MISREALLDQLPHVLKGTSFDGLGEFYSGKVRDNYVQGDKRILITTDRLSAFDRIIALIPHKGAVLNAFTNFWFEKTKDICDSHVLDAPDPNVIVGRQCEPLKVEMVVRAYITGTTSTSAWYHYEKGKREFCGNELPDGLKKNQKLPEIILTPSTKGDDGDHDVSMSPQEIIQRGVVTQEQWNELAEKSLALFKRGAKIAGENGVILVDTKYEFGLTPEGEIILIDEIHTPDSSRFWIADTYEEKFKAGEEPDNINKEFLRLWLRGQGYMGDGPVPEVPDEVRVETAMKYIEAYERITGQKFEVPSGDPIPRIQENLKPYFL